MDEERIQCISCDNEILAVTASCNAGLCGPCHRRCMGTKRNVPDEVEQVRVRIRKVLSHLEQGVIDPDEAAQSIYDLAVSTETGVLEGSLEEIPLNVRELLVSQSESYDSHDARVKFTYGWLTGRRLNESEQAEIVAQRLEETGPRHDEVARILRTKKA